MVKQITKYTSIVGNLIPINQITIATVKPEYTHQIFLVSKFKVSLAISYFEKDKNYCGYLSIKEIEIVIIQCDGSD